MLSDRELNGLRQTQDDNLPETAYIQRLTQSRDDTGGIGQSWATVATTKARLGYPTARDVELGGQQSQQAQFVITLPHSADVRLTDELQIGGINYQIITILRRSKQTALRLLCKRR